MFNVELLQAQEKSPQLCLKKNHLNSHISLKQSCTSEDGLIVWMTSL